MIRVRHETLPAGLSAVVRRRPGGDTDIVVSAALSPARQRAAVREGLRAARPERWRAALPVPLLGVLALASARIRALVRALRIHPVALVSTAGVVSAAAVVIAVVPHLHGPASGSHPAAGGLRTPVPAQTAGSPGEGVRRKAGPPPADQPSPSIVPVAAHPAASAPRPQSSAGGSGSAPGAGTQNASPPASGSSPGAPSPGPTPSPTTGGGRICLDLLGIWVCL